MRPAQRICRQTIEAAVETEAGDLIRSEMRTWGEPKFIHTARLSEQPLVLNFRLHYTDFSEQLTWYANDGDPYVILRMWFKGGVRQERKLRKVNNSEWF